MGAAGRIADWVWSVAGGRSVGRGCIAACRPAGPLWYTCQMKRGGCHGSVSGGGGASVVRAGGRCREGVYPQNMVRLPQGAPLPPSTRRVGEPGAGDSSPQGWREGHISAQLVSEQAAPWRALPAGNAHCSGVAGEASAAAASASEPALPGRLPEVASPPGLLPAGGDCWASCGLAACSAAAVGSAGGGGGAAALAWLAAAGAAEAADGTCLLELLCCW